MEARFNDILQHCNVVPNCTWVQLYNYDNNIMKRFVSPVLNEENSTWSFRLSKLFKSKKVGEIKPEQNVTDYSNHNVDMVATGIFGDFLKKRYIQVVVNADKNTLFSSFDLSLINKIFKQEYVSTHFSLANSPYPKTAWVRLSDVTLLAGPLEFEKGDVWDEYSTDELPPITPPKGTTTESNNNLLLGSALALLFLTK